MTHRMNHTLCLKTVLPLALLALLVLQGSLRVFAESATEEVCNDEGCHKIDASIDVSSEDMEALLAALERVDSELARDIATDVGDHEQPLRALLDKYCLMEVSINPESRVKVDKGQAALVLTTGRWCTFLVKVTNLAGVTARLQAQSLQSLLPTTDLTAHSDQSRWLGMRVEDLPELPAKLSGRLLEYRLISLNTETEGKRTAVVAMDVGQGTADIGFRNDVMLTFDCRQQPHIESLSLTNARRPVNDEEMRFWLENMVLHHRYSIEDVRQATGMPLKEIDAALQRWGIQPGTGPSEDSSKLKLLPYPGGKHPRIGFLDGAIDPQRETKASVFTPWNPKSYVVLDVPEAVWSNLGLTYLAHTHIPTLWDLQKQKLDRLEWDVLEDGALNCVRRLPNGIEFGTELKPTSEAIRMEMWLKNGTDSTLSDLRVQNCVLLKFAKGFEQQTNDNKIFWGPYAACRNKSGGRWIISAWDPAHEAWGNADCPCLHSDPKFPDCEPGETQRLKGWLSFYEGTNIHRELLRIERTGWRHFKRNDDQATEVHG